MGSLSSQTQSLNTEAHDEKVAQNTLKDCDKNGR